MSKLIVRSGHTSNVKMWKAILADLIANGFTLVSYNNTAAAVIPGTDLTSFVIEASNTIDPLSGVGSAQRWRIACKVTAVRTQLYAAAPEQISDLGVLSKLNTIVLGDRSVNEYAGQIGARYTSSEGGTAAENEVCFWHRGIIGSTPGSVYYSGTMAYPQSANNPTLQNNPSSLIFSDPEATPMTYQLAISDHGVALHIGVEGRDSDGCRNAWFVIQRAINSDGSIVTTGKAPLFCMYSVNGGGSIDNNSEVRGVPNSPGSYQIMRFTVRESDVNAPTVAAPAHVHSADCMAVINPYQQVPFSEDGHFDFRLPDGFNTQRYSYPYEMDMVGYASADVNSNGTEVEVTVYGESAKRKFKALSANSPNNTGMRIYFIANDNKAPSA